MPRGAPITTVGMRSTPMMATVSSRTWKVRPPWPWGANVIGFYIPVDRNRDHDQPTSRTSGSAAP